jgi:hypothetical protein
MVMEAEMAALAAKAGGLTLRKIFPWALAAVAVVGLGSWLWVESARLGAAESRIKDLGGQLALSQADTARQTAAVGQRDDVIRDQAAQLTQMRADAAKAQEIADQAEAERQKQLSELNSKIATLKARAHAHPEQVRPLGPIVTDILGGLHKQADPAAAPAGN